jgi:hypothetical protein
MSHLYNKEVDFVDVNKDAFHRLRVSEPYKTVDTQFIANTVNGANVVINTARASANLTTNGSASSVAIHQSRMYHNYMPGKSQLILTTFNLHGNTANVTKRIGYFDANNGIFLEQTGDGTLNWVIRSNVTGTPVERRTAQISWNHDTCDGNGKSGFNLDATKTQLAFIVFQWLGVGSVRCGFATNGKYTVAHEFYNANYEPAVYMSDPNLPIRYEIRNTGTSTGGVLEQICASVQSEGGYVEAGRDWAVSSNSKVVGVGANIPIMAIRLKDTFDNLPNHVTVRLKEVEVFSTAENIKYRVLRLPDLSQLSIGANNWVSVSANSAVEYIDTAYAYTDGQEIMSGYVSAVAQNAQKATAGPASAQEGPTARRNYIAQNIESSNSQIYVLVANNIGTTSTNVFCSLMWREVF